MKERAAPPAKTRRPARGRALKPHPPPTSGEASGGSHGPLVLAADLTRLADHAKLPLTMPAGDLAAEAERIGTAFEWYSIGKRALGRDSPEALKRDWCKAVARQAHDLLLALGQLEGARPGSSGVRFRDGMQVLGQHWPGRETGGDDRYHLERMAWRLEPERLQAQRIKGEDGVGEIWWHFMGQRMPAGLEMLEVLARRGASGYANQVTRGGSDKELARNALFCKLAGSYERLFGALPTIGRADAPDEDERATVPAGPSLEWFKGLFRVVQLRARNLGRRPGTAGPVPDAHLDPQCAVIVAVAKWSLNTGKHADALTNAIRVGATGWLNRPEPEPADPVFKPTPLNNILWSTDD